MREILFRGKMINRGEWITGSLLINTIDECGKIHMDHKISNVAYGAFPNEYMSGYEEIVDPSTVGQCTGLTDKNGVKIFEGDIISVKNENNVEIFRFEVKFGKCGGVHNVEHDVGYMGFYFQPIAKRVEEEYMLRKDPIYWLSAYKCEVIGNIYDNKEQLNDT